MKDLVKKAGREGEFSIASAAVSREEIGNPVYPPARRELQKHGIRCDGHAAHQADPHSTPHTPGRMPSTRVGASAPAVYCSRPMGLPQVQ